VADDVRRAVLLAVPAGERCLEFAREFAQATFVPILAFDATQLRSLVSTLEVAAVVIDDALADDEAALDAIVEQGVVVVLLGDSSRAASRRVHALMPREVTAVELVLRTRAILDLVTEQSAAVYDWGKLRVDTRRRVATFGSAALALSPVQFRMLLVLVKARGAIVTKAELQSAAWPQGGPAGGDRALAHVRRIRARMTEAGGDPSFVLTVRGVGFRLADITAGWDGVDRRRGERRQAIAMAPAS
jgi:DNA-binding response OmpR family regulator